MAFTFRLIIISQLINPVISLTNTSISGVSISFATGLISNVAYVNGCSLCQAQANPLYLRPYIIRIIRAFKRDSSVPLCYALNEAGGVFAVFKTVHHSCIGGFKKSTASLRFARNDVLYFSLSRNLSTTSPVGKPRAWVAL